MSVPRVCLVPRLQGVGGMVSFQEKLSAGLRRRGVEFSQDLKDGPFNAVLVIGGTRDLPGLWRARRQGARIVQRLNGMNWLQRVRPAGWRHFLRAEYGNRLLSLIRGRLAQRIVYQSHFARGWWERVFGPTAAPHTVIYNGVDLDAYTPAGPHTRPQDRWRILMVEGSLMGGYEQGLETAARLGERLVELLPQPPNLAQPLPLELLVAGRVSPQVRAAWEGSRHAASLQVTFAGLITPGEIPTLDRSAHLLYSSDLNAACPNSVVEALACGLPVLAFDTGALPELVTGDAGRVVAYGGDPWRLEPADVPALARAGLDLLANQTAHRLAARQRAEQALGLETMVDQYLRVLLDD